MGKRTPEVLCFVFPDVLCYCTKYKSMITVHSLFFFLRLSQECVYFDFYFFKSFVIVLLNGDCVISYGQRFIKLCKTIRPRALTTVFLTLSSISAPPVTCSSLSVWRRKEKLISTNCLLQMYKFVLGHLHFTGCTSHFRLA